MNYVKPGFVSKTCNISECIFSHSVYERDIGLHMLYALYGTILQIEITLQSLIRFIRTIIIS